MPRPPQNTADLRDRIAAIAAATEARDLPPFIDPNDPLTARLVCQYADPSLFLPSVATFLGPEVREAAMAVALNRRYTPAQLARVVEETLDAIGAMGSPADASVYELQDALLALESTYGGFPDSVIGHVSERAAAADDEGTWDSTGAALVRCHLTPWPQELWRRFVESTPLDRVTPHLLSGAGTGPELWIVLLERDSIEGDFAMSAMRAHPELLDDAAWRRAVIDRVTLPTVKLLAPSMTDDEFSLMLTRVAGLRIGLAAAFLRVPTVVARIAERPALLAPLLGSTDPACRELALRWTAEGTTADQMEDSLLPLDPTFPRRGGGLRSR